MGVNVAGRYFSKKEIKETLERKGYTLVEKELKYVTYGEHGKKIKIVKSTCALKEGEKPNKGNTIEKVFKKLVVKVKNESNKKFLDKL